jgi:plasmid stabilization system protein ParE
LTAIQWSAHSIHDLEAIRACIADDSPFYANLIVQRLVSAVERLGTFPESGRVVPELGSADIREVIVRPYRVVYRLRQQAVGYSRPSWRTTW